MHLIAAAAPAPNWWPFVTLLVSIGLIIFLITRLRMHAFIALILAAFVAGFLTLNFKPDAMNSISASMRDDAKANSWVAAVELASIEFGKAAGAIAISIGLASIIGLCLMESGSADKVVRRFLAAFGEKRAGLALLASTYILSIPIFFDTMFMLMVPLAKALRLRTGRDYMLYLMCICMGGVVTHSLTVPHPGPLAMVDTLRVDAGLSLLIGIAAGILPCIFGYFVARWLNNRSEIPLRETPGTTLEELKGISDKHESQLPSFFWSITPVLLPILLISAASFFKIIKGTAVQGWFGDAATFEGFAKIAFFVGNKNIALGIGTVIALWVLARQRGFSFAKIEELLGPPLETAGVIILITAAGGAFGGMLRHAGVGDAIGDVAKTYSIPLLLLGWLTAAVIRIAQGSATVAMLTTSAIMWDMINPGSDVPASQMVAAMGAKLGFHPMYMFLSIGFGAFCCSWMNDSGFWVVNRLSGMTEKETLRSWTVMLTVTSIMGLVQVLLLAKLLPLV
jgi:gluconate:H+ symporter, GntP family